MMRLSKFGGNPNIGVYSAANESLAFISSDASEEYIRDVERALDVETHLTTIAGSFVVGSLIAMNSNGAVMSGQAEEHEIKLVSSFLPVILLNGKYNAAGNNVLCNDNGALVNPEMEDDVVKAISEVLGVRCERASIGEINTIGSACKATNKGAVCHPDATDEEMNHIQDVLGVEVRRTTLNHGSKLLGPCLLANSKGAVVGDLTTPIEMGKLEDALDLI